MNILVSFCNVFPPGMALGILDFDGNQFRWMDLSGAGERVIGATGICWQRGSHWVLLQFADSQRCGVAELDERLELRRVHQFSEIRDAHSMIAYEDGLLVNDTGRNRLTLVELPVNGGALREIEYWRYCDAPTDVSHINSLAEFDGEVVVSLFGPRPEGGYRWRGSRNGRILGTRSGRVFCGDLHHPHSLLNVGGDLYWLESGNSAVHRLSRKGEHEIVVRLEGYLRGLRVDDGHIYVGCSAQRRRSKSMGTANWDAPESPEHLQSWLYLVNRGDGSHEQRALTALGAEVFDVEPLANAADRIRSNEVDPVTQRFWKCEDIVEELTNWATDLRAQLEDRDARIADLVVKLTEQETLASALSQKLEERESAVRETQSPAGMERHVQGRILRCLSRVRRVRALLLR